MDEAYREWTNLGSERSLHMRTYGPSYHKGIRLARSGAVKQIAVEPYTAEAAVQDKDDVYDVVVWRDDESARCSCGKMGFMGLWCEHIVAVLAYMHDDIHEAAGREQRRHDAIDSIMAAATPQKVMEYMTSKMKRDYHVYADFLEEMGIKDISALPDPERLLKRTYKWFLDKGRIRRNMDLDMVFDIARDLRDAGRHGSATGAYKALISAISDNMWRTDDADGFYADCLMEAVEQMAESAAREKPDAETMGGYISYMLGMCEKADGGMAMRYADALKVMCDTPDGVGMLEEMIDAALRRGLEVGVAAALAHVKVYVLEETDRHAEAASFLAGAYHADEELAVKYVGMLPGEDREGVRRGARNATAAFPDSVKVARAALGALNERDPEYLQMASGLFAETGEWTYLDMAKRVAPDWNGQLGRIRDAIAQSKPDLVAKMYLREKMYEDAMDAVEAADRLEVYYSFRPRLAGRHRARYFGAYSEKILEFIAARTGRDHYAKCKEHLRRIKRIPGSEKMFGDLLTEVRSRFRARRLLLAAIRDM